MKRAWLSCLSEKDLAPTVGSSGLAGRLDCWTIESADDPIRHKAGTLKNVNYITK